MRYFAEQSYSSAANSTHCEPLFVRLRFPHDPSVPERYRRPDTGIAADNLHAQLLGCHQTGNRRDWPRCLAAFIHGDGSRLGASPRFIVYGDMRFTDLDETKASLPGSAPLLVARIGREKPDAVFLTGDVPWHGGNRPIMRSTRRRPLPGGASSCACTPCSATTNSKGCSGGRLPGALVAGVSARKPAGAGTASRWEANCNSSRWTAIPRFFRAANRGGGSRGNWMIFRRACASSCSCCITRRSPTRRTVCAPMRPHWRNSLPPPPPARAHASSCARRMFTITSASSATTYYSWSPAAAAANRRR
jgi:hypothetical protein